MARDRYDHQYGPGVSYREVDLRPHRNEPDSDPNFRGGAYAGMRMEPGDRHQGAYGWYRRAFARDLRWDGGADGRYDPRWDPRRGRFDADGYFHDPFDDARRHVGRAPRGYDASLMPGGAYDQELRRRYGAGPRGGYDDEVRGWDHEMVRRDAYDEEMRERGGPLMGSPRSHPGGPWDGGVRSSNAYLRQYNRFSPSLGDRENDAWYGYAEGSPSHPDDPRGRPADERGYAGYSSAGYTPQPRHRGPR